MFPVKENLKHVIGYDKGLDIPKKTKLPKDLGK